MQIKTQVMDRTLKVKEFISVSFNIPSIAMIIVNPINNGRVNAKGSVVPYGIGPQYPSFHYMFRLRKQQKQHETHLMDFVLNI